MHWITNKELPLKQWVRNRVVEILRFSEANSWRYVHSSDLIADLGTRVGASITDISPGSAWIQGYSWMSKEISSFPVKTCSEIKLTNSEIVDIKEELMIHKNIEDVSNIDWSQNTSNYLVWNTRG